MRKLYGHGSRNKRKKKGHLTEECTCQTIVLILKGKDDFYGIGLVGVLWKTVMGIVK